MIIQYKSSELNNSLQPYRSFTFSKVPYVNTLNTLSSTKVFNMSCLLSLNVSIILCDCHECHLSLSSWLEGPGVSANATCTQCSHSLTELLQVSTSTISTLSCEPFWSIGETRCSGQCYLY